MINSGVIVRNAWRAGLVVPAFNVPYLPMIEPIIRAVCDADCFAFVATARLEWYKFDAKSAKAVFETYKKYENTRYVRLHLDHVPVIDEDGQRVDYVRDISEALQLGYHSVMVDGSRLPLEENIQATAQIAEMAHQAGVPCEAELGAVFGHEAGPPPPYEELFATGKGFTDVEEAARFVKETACDWLSVAVGNIHGAVSGALRDKPKVTAKINIDHLRRLRDATGVPLVLHGGSGIDRTYVREAIRNGIAKINIGTEIRQVYENALRQTGDLNAAQDAVYERTLWMLREYFELSGTRSALDVVES
ncbi:MAG TPA: class II fructose-bisphosphate aldolase [Candidatus Hydrogenedentes bacterium]|nr:class II fructose-bisphosphate aldolase [Candidatus Hydrogenedentota bacterium]HOL77113.1 class II fructose-bisphosphate aldolase [Candidatus Hydrogenedentota bacterium]HPO86968.1 class II fructose-bisphosphate aldolase [Candidatus Hydrogenedentota bacterium]